MGFLGKNWERRAGKLLKDPRKLHLLLSNARKKAQGQKKRLNQVWEDLKGLLEMVQASVRGDYRLLPFKSLFSAILALVYFVNPFDILPDVLLFGLIDDVMVLGWVMASLKADLDNYRTWAHQQK